MAARLRIRSVRVGGVFKLNDHSIYGGGNCAAGFLWRHLRSTPPDFFLPLNAEPLVQSDADLNKYVTHWLALIGRIQPDATPASIEAEMRVALKQWLALALG